MEGALGLEAVCNDSDSLCEPFSYYARAARSGDRTAGSLALGRFIKNWLFGVEAIDVATITAVGALLDLVTLFASWLPARRATSANPVDSLRTE